MSSDPLSLLLPVVRRPETHERLSSWLSRLAAIYGMSASVLLDQCGLARTDPLILEQHLDEGEAALLARRTGLSAAAIDAMTFLELAPAARFMIARRSRSACIRCADDPSVQRKDAALPWGFWCSAHGVRRQPAGGQPIETLFPAALLAELDTLASRGARRLAAWAEGADAVFPGIPDLIDFLTLQHRRPSPPSLAEQPRMSLAARRANHAFLTRPIARQALLVVVPEYDRVAPVLAKPVRSGLKALARSSLLQDFALAIGIARLTQSPVEQAAAVLMASDAERQDRVREALRAWPLALRRRVSARYRRLCEVKADRQEGARAVSRRRPVSKTPSRSVS